MFEWQQHHIWWSKLLLLGDKTCFELVLTQEKTFKPVLKIQILEAIIGPVGGPVKYSKKPYFKNVLTLKKLLLIKLH